MSPSNFSLQAARVSTARSTKQKGVISSSILVLGVFAIAFFPRTLEALGAPAPINFAHFVLLPVACGIVVVTSQSKNRYQLATVKAIAGWLLVLFSIAIASALLNNAGVVNIFLELMILSEPFILIATILSIPFTLQSLNRFRKWILGFGAVHLALAFCQKAGLETGLLNKDNPLTFEDNIQGAFYLSFGGHTVGAAVSIAFGLYFYISAKTVPLWIRGSVIAAVIAQILFADAKQVLFTAFMAGIMLVLSKTKDIRATLQYLIAALLIGYIFYWCIYNVEVFRPYQIWIRPGIYARDGDATLLKIGGIEIIISHFNSLLNWFLGLGPGHTVGRIGGWILESYWSMLEPLGATMSPVSQEVWDIWDGHYLESSFFSPLWGWLGVWGDLGFLGLASYIALWTITWNRICKDDVSRFLVLSVISNGFIYTLMEEPGFVLTSIVLVGLRYHELRLKEEAKQLSVVSRSF